MDIKEIGKRIRNYRISRGLTQAELAERLKFTPQTVSKWERGQSAPDIVVLSDLCCALGITASLLLDGDFVESECMIAVDGGATKTEFVVFNSKGEILDRAYTQGTNPNACGLEESERIIRGALDKLLASHTSVTRIYCGIAGTSAGDNKEKLASYLRAQYPAYKINVESDIMNIIGMAEKNNRCIAVIVGTGSVAVSYDGVNLLRKGGWGYFFDGAGSGYDMGKDAIALALAAEDGLAPESKLTRLVEAKLGAKPFECLSAIYKRGAEYIASFAPLVFSAMRVGDGEAEKIIVRSVKRIALLIKRSLDESGSDFSVIIGGGIAKGEAEFRERLLSELDGIKVEFATLPPILGAMRRCLDLCSEKYEFKNLCENFKRTYAK